MAFFGVLTSPFEVAEWQEATGIRPDLCMIFEHWDQQRPLDAVFAKAKSLGYSRIMLTWEPWTPTGTGIGNAAQGALQPEWSCESIANGQHDAYIRMISKSIRESGLEKVYVRWGHEMNGDWHPWRITPEWYVKAYQRIVNAFRGGGTYNAKFIWSPNSSLYQDNINFLRGVLPYWPGKNYAEYGGLTMINFGGEKNVPVSDFAARFQLCKSVFGRPLIASEVNCAWEVRDGFLNGLNGWISTNNPLSGLVLSQPSISRGQANGVSDGDMQWSIVDDPAMGSIEKRIITQLHESPLT